MSSARISSSSPSAEPTSTEHDEHHGPPEAHASSRIDRQTLGILLFIVSEIMLFGAFFASYFFIRVVANQGPWPPEPYELPVAVAGVNTAILISSSFTMHWALEGARNENRNALSAEITVPLVGRSAERLQVVPGTWIQRISTAFVNVCPDPGDAPDAVAECEAVQRAVRSALPDGVVVVAPNTEPSIEAPLGWTLSQQSRSVLCVKLRDQMTPEVVDATRATVPYGTFAELLAVLEPDDPAYSLDAAESVTPLCR